MIKIIVDTQKEKEDLIEESEYLNDFIEFVGFLRNQGLRLSDIKTKELINIHKNPDCIDVKNNFSDIDKFYVE